MDGWLTDEKLKSWLIKKIESSGEVKAYCGACNEPLLNHKSVLVRHNTSTKHEKSMETFSFSALEAQQRLLAEHVGFSQDVKVAEYCMTILSLIADRHLAISFVDFFIPALIRLHPESATLKKVQCHRTKAGAIIRDGRLHKFKN